jgi:hypothetical protein
MADCSRWLQALVLAPDFRAVSGNPTPPVLQYQYFGGGIPTKWARECTLIVALVVGGLCGVTFSKNLGIQPRPRHDGWTDGWIK